MKNWAKAILISLFGTTLYGQNPEGFEKMAKNMAGDRAPIIKLEELKTKSVVFLDSREKEEFDVSHIPGSTYVGYDNFSLKNLPKVEKSDTMVVYCSVGYRSGKIAEKLIKEGYSNVFNLYGGYFGYANDGGKTVNNNGETTNVIHGYSKKWSEWLNPEKCDATY